ncbi:MAG TPA: hypothetical protein VGF20_16035 [Candidatus Acidoferrum sp.]
MPQRSAALEDAEKEIGSDADEAANVDVGDGYVNIEAEAEAGEQPAEPGDPNRDPFCSFWKGTDLRVCTEICTVLDEAGIPHKTIRRQDYLFNLNNQSPYEVGVPASVYEKAELAIKDAFGTDEGTGEDAVPLLPAPGEDSIEPFDERGKGRATEEERVEANEWLGPRYPEDATVEVWSGEDVGLRDMIEMSLKENDVLTRSEEQAGGARVFVLPGDEGRAKEIVREIVEGAPLE